MWSGLCASLRGCRPNGFAGRVHALTSYRRGSHHSITSRSCEPSTLTGPGLCFRSGSVLGHHRMVLSTTTHVLVASVRRCPLHSDSAFHRLRKARRLAKDRVRFRRLKRALACTLLRARGGVGYPAGHLSENSTAPGGAQPLSSFHFPSGPDKAERARWDYTLQGACCPLCSSSFSPSGAFPFLGPAGPLPYSVLRRTRRGEARVLGVVNVAWVHAASYRRSCLQRILEVEGSKELGSDRGRHMLAIYGRGWMSRSSVHRRVPGGR